MRRLVSLSLVVLPAALAGQDRSPSQQGSAVKVGPERGTVIVVGGGSMGPEIYSAFIKAAGGPDALIIDVPTAGGDTVYNQNAPGTRGWRQAGARNVYVLHTNDKKLADSDSFAAILKKAGGVWFEGGRQFHLVDSYAGTKTEAGFHDVLARGGVVGGSSAGASILGDFLVRGAPSNDNFIMDYPGYQKGFAFLRGVGIDQHVVARERLPDLADSIMPKYPSLLGMSEDEGTAWVVRGDTATIVGRDKAFVYGGKDATDKGKPFLTLYPGDRYNLSTRQVMHRAASESKVSVAFLDSLFKPFAEPSAGGATVLVAEDGKVLVDRSYGIPDQAKYMPTTTVPQFQLGEIARVFTAMCAQLPIDSGGRGRGGRGGAANQTPPTPLQNCFNRRFATPVGLHKTTMSREGQVQSDADELYRVALGYEVPRTFARDTTTGDGAASHSVDLSAGWETDNRAGAARLSAYAVAGGKRSAFVRLPDRHATIVVLTNSETTDVKRIVDALTDRLIGK
ncbi:MAG TPA: Type 1 glutamine amidotransferase-like domain-containing protein [Gemmatimonadaceae bacterium]|jgi:cyanophycinase|nr:Type 1 glutamine amidotransferase-like domain-containing protein [Gemmatimonadaceae bacterium]